MQRGKKRMWREWNRVLGEKRMNRGGERREREDGSYSNRLGLPPLHYGIPARTRNNYCVVQLQRRPCYRQANSAFHPFGVDKWVAKLLSDEFYLAVLAQSSECCEVKAYLIRCWQNLGAVCFWQPIPSGLNLVVAAVLRDSLCVVSLLPCVTDCCMLYNVCKAERFVLTIILSSSTSLLAFISIEGRLLLVIT